MYDLYIFDLGNVIITDIDVVPSICRRLGSRSEEFVSLYTKHAGTLMTGEMSSSEFWQLLSGPAVEEDLLAACFKPKIDLRMLEMLRHLKKQRCRVVCGTNTYASHYEILRYWDFMNLFDRVYASHLMSLAKPDERFYRFIIEHEQAHNKRIFFTDDLQENIEGAAACGIDACLFTSPDSLQSIISW
ncbi:MAG: HAD hydrolase-like protein [Spirochaetia bacterium]|nr:HAD hydrolase-like protein [Spirochaetia bacterium]